MKNEREIADGVNGGLVRSQPLPGGVNSKTRNNKEKQVNIFYVSIDAIDT